MKEFITHALLAFIGFAVHSGFDRLEQSEPEQVAVVQRGELDRLLEQVSDRTAATRLECAKPLRDIGIAHSEQVVVSAPAGEWLCKDVLAVTEQLRQHDRQIHVYVMFTTYARGWNMMPPRHVGAYVIHLYCTPETWRDQLQEAMQAVSETTIPQP